MINNTRINQSGLVVALLLVSIACTILLGNVARLHAVSVEVFWVFLGGLAASVMLSFFVFKRSRRIRGHGPTRLVPAFLMVFSVFSWIGARFLDDPNLAISLTFASLSAVISGVLLEVLAFRA